MPSPFFATQNYLFSLLSTVTRKLPPYLLLPTYYQTTISLLPPTCHCLYLPLPLTACHYYLPHPATTYQFLPPSLLATTCFFLPLSTCHCLPQSDTTPTCHYLPLPATACYYLLLPDYQLLPLLAIICHNLSAGPVAESATTETIQQTRMPNNLNRFLLENSFRQRISSSWFVFWNRGFWPTWKGLKA